MKRLVLLVEGHYDGPAVAHLVKTIMAYSCPEAFETVFLDHDAIRTGNVPKVSGRFGRAVWLEHIRNAGRRKHVAGILAVLDGDEDFFEGQPFCPAVAARALAGRAAEAGSGTTHSVAVVILRQEFESLLLAAAAQLSGLKADARLEPDPEVSPRGAKKWLRDNLTGGYSESGDQLTRTREVTDWGPVRARMRSFRRLECAVLQLVRAAVSGQHVATPTTPPPPAAP